MSESKTTTSWYGTLCFIAVLILAIVFIYQGFQQIILVFTHGHAMETLYEPLLLAVIFSSLGYLYSQVPAGDEPKKPATDEKLYRVELPEKVNMENGYVDDQRIADMIDDAIDKAADSTPTGVVDTLLNQIEKNISDWQPYDTSDAHLEMIWLDKIKAVRSYIYQIKHDRKMGARERQYGPQSTD